ncbi:serine/threonine-protein kinase [Streptomyces mangrovisoli]|uniref:non-specific serine/threonine protein kinase n=1 Tax=Streptomyces mangrovisoli TaxID=1428628 RepID=A0A1J4NY35_9ACTN|nr:serine/threonine-protein kinase [Streptomyces mangrovisoli]OIJ67441.1 serine/threonine protein kinase [Streptomyces mangrovisoli]
MGTEGAAVRVIAGRYRLEERIGRGGMGIVWRATDQLLGRRVAVKEIAQDDSLPDTEARRHRDRTLREARAVAQLRHPHVIVVHDVVEQDERPYIVMELIDGGSLADRVSAHGPLDAREVARIGVDLLGALRTAHAAGVLHRDIKPANVLVDSGTGRVVLTDFGIAQVAGATTLTETGSFVGSPEYTAPERMSGARTGPESDLWSLGALLCTALSGESPFRRDSLGGILHAVVFDEIRTPAQAAPLLPVVRGLLERDPDRRLGVAEAERLLRAFLDTGRTPATRASGYTPTRRDAPRPGGTAPADAVPAAGSGPGSGAGSGFGQGAGAGVGHGVGVGHGIGVGHGAVSGHGSGAGHGSGSVSATGSGSATGSATAEASALAPRHSTRGLLVAALLVAATAGAGVSAAALLMQGGGGGGRPVASTHTGATEAPGRSASRSPSSSGGATTAVPTATVTVTGAASAPGTSGTRTAPSGYRLARDPEGFSLAVPEDFTRDPQGVRIFYMSPGETFRIGVKVAAPGSGGPLAVMNRSAAAGPDNNPGYRDGQVTATTHDGHDAALWEFTWDGFSAAEGPRHTYDLCWEEAGRMYDVWVSAPVGKVREAKEYFDVALDTFARS